MNTLAEPVTPNVTSVQTAIDAACARIAPTWPLDRFIAVNPYWGQLDRPIAAAAAQLAGLSGSPMLMPRSWMRNQWQAGRIDRQHLQAAIIAAGDRASVE
ncbi:MAG: putative inorganic carbon transporter subunit DabA, partial [Rhodoferax sp.]